MTDELGRNQLTSQLKYWQQECRICAEHHNYNCNECVCRKRCVQAKKQIKALIQKPRVTEEFVEKWATRWKNINCYYEVAVKEMLKEAGVEIVSSQEVDKKGR